MRQPTLRIDDLLAARVVAKQLPHERERLLRVLGALRAGAAERSLLFTLVADGALEMDQARAVQQLVERHKRGRALAAYTQLLVRAGSSEARVRALAERLGSESDLNELGEAVVAEGLLPREREQALRFEARVALDRELAEQVRQHLAAHGGGTPEPPARSPSGLDTGKFLQVAALPQAGTTEFRLAPRPPKAAAEPPVEGPGFAIPTWIDTADASYGRPAIGPYRIVGLIGAGGMGRVFLTYDPARPERPVAVKVLHKGASADALGRFRRELLANGLLQHDAVLEIYDGGENEEGEHFLAMEFFDGQNLAKVLAEEGRLGARTAISIARQVAQALGAVHGAKVVHRDLKPDNVLLAPARDRIKLMDFGIALVQGLGEFEDRVFHTMGNALIGTPRYMSPEQAGGEALDPRSDLYALGLVLYEMLAGRSPFEAEGDVGFVACHMVEDPCPLREADPFTEFLPPELHDLVDRLLRKDPDERPPSAAEVETTLGALLPKVVDA